MIEFFSHPQNLDWALTFAAKLLVLTFVIYLALRYHDELIEALGRIFNDALTDYDNKTYDTGRIAFYLSLFAVIAGYFALVFSGKEPSIAELGGAIVAVFVGIGVYLKTDASRPTPEESLEMPANPNANDSSNSDKG